GVLGEIEFQAGNPEAALQLCLEEAEAAREYSHTHSLCGALSNAAGYAVALGRFHEARDYAREALSLALDDGFELIASWALQHLAAICAFRSQRKDVDNHVDLELAARALGFVDTRFAQLERSRDFTEQQERDKMLDLLRDQLGN